MPKTIYILHDTKKKNTEKLTNIAHCNEYGLKRTYQDITNTPKTVKEKVNKEKQIEKEKKRQRGR